MTTTPEVSSISVPDILATSELSGRPDANYDAAANSAYVELARISVEKPGLLLQRLCDLALELCSAGTAGISILRKADGESQFHWDAMAGTLAGFVGGKTPRDFSPCGVTLDRGCTQLFAYPGRVFTYFNAVSPAIVEGLVVPFYEASGNAIGTIWIVSHDEHRFNLGHVRVMEGLAAFTGAAYELLKARGIAEQAALSSEHKAIELTASNLVKDEFIGLVSHELRSPLTTILGYARMLKGAERLDPETITEAVAEIEREGVRLQGMINNFLMAARPELPVIEFEPIVIQRLLTTITRSMNNSSSEVILEACESDDLIVLGEASLITQVVENLINNAAKYGAAGKPIHVTLTAHHGEALISVRDHGPGVPESEREAIFDSYYRSEATSGAAGLGLGLVVCKRLVTAQGGRIWLSSPEGGGAEFTFTVPLLPPEAE